MIRAALAVAAAASTALVAASAEGAPKRDLLIVPGQQIGKVRIGMSFAQVRRALGRPTGVNKRTRLGFTQYVEYDWGYGRWTVGLSGRSGAMRVSLVATTLRRERTREGAGVGTRIRRVASVYRNRGIRCDSRLVAGKLSYYDSCRLRSRTGHVTYFAVAHDCIDPDASYPCPEDYLVYEVLIRSQAAPRPTYD